MNWSKLDATLSAKMSEDQHWLLQGPKKYPVFVTLEDGSIHTGEFTSLGVADLSCQSWVKAIRLSGVSKPLGDTPQIEDEDGLSGYASPKGPWAL